MSAPDLDFRDGDAELEHTKRAAKRLLIDFLEGEAKTQPLSRVCLVEDAVIVLRDELLAWAKEGDG